MYHVELPPWSIGLLFAMCGYTLCGLGFSMIKLSHIKRSGTHTPVLNAANSYPLRDTPFNRRSSSRSHVKLLWIMGYVINSTGGLLNTIGLRFSAQSLIAALSSWAILSNTIFGIYILGERLYYYDILPICLITVGNLLTVLNANHSDQQNLSLSDINNLFKRRSFHIYVLAICALSAVLLVLRHNILVKIRKLGGKQFNINANLIAYEALCITCISTMFCVNSVFLSKITLLSLSLNNLKVFLSFQFILLISIWLCLVLFWIYTLNHLLASHDVLFIVPTIEVLWSLCSMIGGGIFFDEYSSMTLSKRFYFVLGVIINLTGVLALSRRGDKSSKLG